MADRLANNQCLWCGVPLVRTDGFPLCGSKMRGCEKKYHIEMKTKLAEREQEKKGGKRPLGRKEPKTMKYSRLTHVPGETVEL